MQLYEISYVSGINSAVHGTILLYKWLCENQTPLCDELILYGLVP